MKLYDRRAFMKAIVSTAAVSTPAVAHGILSPGAISGAGAFSVRFRTSRYRPSAQVSIRTGADNWQNDLLGSYQHGEWVFDLLVDHFPRGMEFKFVLDKHHWMGGPNLFLEPRIRATTDTRLDR